MQIPHNWLTQAWSRWRKSVSNHRIPATHDLHHLRCFKRIVKYLSKFDHLLMTKCEPLNISTWKDKIFQWAEVQQSIWRHKKKKPIANTPVNLLWLRKASHDTDWHAWYRHGNCPLAEWETSVIHVKGLERLWKNYTPNEKEMRAVVFGLHKFSDYCHRRHYKPLEASSNKPLSKAPKRL